MVHFANTSIRLRFVSRPKLNGTFCPVAWLCGESCPGNNPPAVFADPRRGQQSLLHTWRTVFRSLVLCGEHGLFFGIVKDTRHCSCRYGKSYKPMHQPTVSSKFPVNHNVQSFFRYSLRSRFPRHAGVSGFPFLSCIFTSRFRVFSPRAPFGADASWNVQGPLLAPLRPPTGSSSMGGDHPIMHGITRHQPQTAGRGWRRGQHPIKGRCRFAFDRSKSRCRLSIYSRWDMNRHPLISVPIGGGSLDYSGNCGNMASGVGPFSVE